VLSTLHTNGSVATLTRLLEMASSRFLASAAGVAHAAAARKPASRAGPTPTPESVSICSGESAEDALPRRRLSGCRGIGYRGRVGVFELLTMNAELRRLPSRARRGRNSRRRPRLRPLDAS
jgi:type II secretory ATPase GspE/PulE/Tfp pilus assembly ATPase PilB-like protein